MYASHRDACILSYYSKQLSETLDSYYTKNSLSDVVIAYRSLGKGNYDFSAEAHSFAEKNQPVTIMAFDVTGFFDNLDHKLLKKRLRKVFGEKSLPTDWYKIFSFVTKYHFVKLEDLKKVPEFARRLKCRTERMIAPIAEVREAKVKIYPNHSQGKGIPQGTPISATLSNAYMVEFDENVKQYCDSIGAFYRRYSDDILIICKPVHKKSAMKKIKDFIDLENLNLSMSKTEVSDFSLSATGKKGGKAAQYLGFTLNPSGASIRPGSLSRQWRKMRNAIRKAENDASAAIASGNAKQVYTKRLRMRFSSMKSRNFSSYARRSANAFPNKKKILRQVRRFEREFENKVDNLKRKLNK